MALQGAYGPEAQAEALAAVGMEYDPADVGEEEGSEQAEEEWLNEAIEQIEGQLQAVEAAIGRELTEKEWRGMVKGISHADLDQGAVPDLVECHAEELRGRDGKDLRIEQGADAAQRVFDEHKEAEEPPMFSGSPQAEPGGGEGYEDEGYDEGQA